MVVSKDSGKSRFKLVTGEIDGHEVRVYDKERVICDCLRYRNKMDKEIFNKAVQNYINDPGKCGCNDRYPCSYK